MLDTYESTCYNLIEENKNIQEVGMTKRELIKLLKSNGFYQLKNRGKGSHEAWTNGTRQVIVPKPNGADYPVGTANAILKQAGLK